jgi:apolipoprotein N-acyltransferase
MMPELNAEFRQAYRGQPLRGAKDYGGFLDDVHDVIAELATTYRTNVLAGGVAMLPGTDDAGKPHWSRRNSAFYFGRSGTESATRYDKIHLVPFGEFMPFKQSFPLLYKLLNVFNPYGAADYTVMAGEDLTVFTLDTWRFVAPICFEDVDSALVARMFRPDGSQAGGGGKRADFIVNLTNDGWFAFNQMPQHLQIAVFRSIENRAPTARAVNTGISGFIDSVGRTYDLIPTNQAGARTARLGVDRRITFYTRFGDLFAGACVLVSAALLALAIWNRMKNRSRAGR